jgi:alpha-1,2-mannosyltransferase
MELLLAEAQWLNGRRTSIYARLIVALYAAVILIVLALSSNSIDPLGKPIGTDFIGFWAAGRMALEGQATEAYDGDLHEAAEQRALPWRAGQQAPFLPFLYPPTFLMAAAALALLPYGAALGLWFAGTVPIYLAAVRGIVQGWNALFIALAFPAVLLNLAHGQTGFLTTGLLGGALLLLERRPWLSGVLFGLLAYKPHFGVMIPLALLVGGYWRTICAAGLTIAITVACSWVAWGGEPWRAFLSTLQTVGSYGLEHSSDGLEKLQSVFAAVRVSGGGVELAWALQAIFALISAASVVWIWRRPGSLALKGAALCVATLMLAPYLFDYDLLVLALPIAWLASIGLDEGFWRWEKAILLAAWLLPLLSRTMAKYLHLPVAPIVMALLLAVVVRRSVSAGTSSAGTTPSS